MRNRILCKFNWLLSFVMAALLAALSPAVVLAQQGPPQPALQRAPALWLGLLIISVLLAIVLAVSLMPSKRSHQD